jgi:hypothetical protein
LQSPTDTTDDRSQITPIRVCVDVCDTLALCLTLMPYESAVSVVTAKEWVHFVYMLMHASNW